MPWHVGTSDSCPASKPYAVVEEGSGAVRGCHPTRKAAIQQLRALYVNVPEARPKAVAEWEAAMAELIELAGVDLD